MSNLFQIGPYSLQHPQFLFLLLLLPLWWLGLRKNKGGNKLLLSDLQGLQSSAASLKVQARKMLPLLRLCSIILIIIALARPRESHVNEMVDTEGIDIVMSLDISGSMLAEDFRPNRIEAAKKVAGDFIRNRSTDRIGLVIFSGESFTQCPLTTDQGILQQQLKAVRSGLLEDGTAIGMGLATAVDRLRGSKAKTKIIILLTDGVNNSGLIDPITALEIAKAYKVRVYTIGVGSQGMANYPVQDAMGRTTMQQMPVQIDESLLKKISSETGGQYFRATDNKSLNTIYSAIDKMEKTRIEISTFKRYAERFTPFAALALLLILIEQILRLTWLRGLP